MELEELKDHWKVHTGNSEWKLTSNAIESMVAGKAENARSKLLRIMGWDAILMIGINLLFIAVLYILDLQLKHLSALLILAVMFVLFAHYHFHTLIIRQRPSVLSVRDGIRRTLMILKRYIFFYQYIIPVIFALIVAITLYNNAFVSLGISAILANLPYSLGIGISSAFLTGVAIRFLVGYTLAPEIRELKELYAEMSEHK